MKSLLTVFFSLALLAPAASAQGVRTDTIVPDASTRAAAATLSELLAARVPGLQVRPGSGAVGSGSRLRLRGASGLVEVGDPLVVVDGVRVVRDPADLQAVSRGPFPSRLDDFVPDDIDRVEVLSGPAAVARYGSEAVNGVIEVWTRRGARGAPRLRAYVEAGVANDATRYPASFGRVGRFSNGTRTDLCTLFRQSIGLCVPVGDSLLSVNLLEDGNSFRTGGRRRAGASVGGGTGWLTYLAGANGERDQGVLRHDSRERDDAHAAFTLRPMRGVEVSASALRLRNELELPAAGTFFDPILTGLLTGPFDEPFPAVDSAGTSQNVRRTLGTASARLTPLGWLTLGGRFGIDDVETDELVHDFQEDVSFGRLRTTGQSGRVRRNADAFAEARYALPGELRLATMLGAERWSTRSRGERRSVRSRGTDSTYTVEGFGLSDRTLAVLGQQRVSWRDRATASLTVRREEPKRWEDPLLSGALSAEWEALGGKGAAGRRWLDGLRLRAAYSRAEVAPPVDVLFTVSPCGILPCDFEPVTAERHRQAEGGFDAALLRGRAGVSLTVYDRATGDAVARLIRPSSSAFYRNVGTVTNRGAEATVRIGAAADARLFWEVEGIAAFNRNRLELDDGLASILGMGRQQSRDGRPVWSFFGRRVTGVEDRDGDGLIGAGCTRDEGDACGVRLSPDAEYLGPADPTRMVALRGRVRARGVEISALLDHQGGNFKEDLTTRFRCEFGFCQAVNDPSTPLAEQARIVALLIGRESLLADDASFTRIREASLSVGVPERWVRGIGGRELRFTLAGRNLATWTPFGGLDPETSADGQESALFREDFTQPLPRSLTTRLDVSF